jgi:hypothetical protein
VLVSFGKHSHFLDLLEAAKFADTLTIGNQVLSVRPPRSQPVFQYNSHLLLSGRFAISSKQ